MRQLRPRLSSELERNLSRQRCTGSGSSHWKISPGILNYALTPGNNLVDARVNLYYNQANLLYEPNSTSSSYRGRTAEALGWGGDFSNTSRFALSDELGLKLFYGASYNMDDYSVTYRGANAPGTLENASGFADGTRLKVGF